MLMIACRRRDVESRMRAGSIVVALSLAVLGTSSPGGASERGPHGLWNRDDGRGGIRIVSCGGKLCGDIVWLKDPNGPGRVGQRVLFNMEQTAQNTWSGTAVNPEDGQNYAGSMTFAGTRLTTQGCALGGMVCRSVGLSRAR